VQRDLGGARAHHAHKLGRQVVLLPVALRQIAVAELQECGFVARGRWWSVCHDDALTIVGLVDGDLVVLRVDANHLLNYRVIKHSSK